MTTATSAQVLFIRLVLKAIIEKLTASDRTQAAVLAVQMGLVMFTP